MFVTAIQPNARRKSQLDIFLDGVVAGNVSRRVVKKRSLRPGLELSHEQFEAIVAEDRRRMALDTAVRMLSRRPRSEREVRRRLKQRRVDETTIEGTIERLREARLLDDAEYARSFAESRDRISPRSQRLIERELRAAGVDGAVAAEAVAEISDEESAYRLAATRLRTFAGLEYATFASRLSSLLRRRGFGWSVSRATIERCWAEAGSGRGEDGFDSPIVDQA
jgi:regulatory protein